MDEVNLDEFLRETSDAIDDPEKFSLYIREKATIAIERFLVSSATVSLTCLDVAAIMLQERFPSHLIICFARTTYRKCLSPLSGVISVMGGFSHAMAMMEEGLRCRM